MPFIVTLIIYPFLMNNSEKYWEIFKAFLQSQIFEFTIQVSKNNDIELCRKLFVAVFEKNENIETELISKIERELYCEIYGASVMARLISNSL